ncbi:uncharacterized protein LOC141613616 [Silene latifolia]|uniref:uncharacterized protein LOC141613616 n=1 Tax=Silene latifolia TaxID=37657 RepID=UPI003D76BBBE
MSTEALLAKMNDTLELLTARLAAVETKEELPKNFVLTDIPKFKGTENPLQHIRSYKEHLALKSVSASMLTAIFAQFLEEHPRAWFYNLDIKNYPTFEDLTTEFCRHYADNAKIQTIMRTLEVMTQREKECFTDFLAHWRAESVTLTKKPEEVDMVDKFVKNLQPAYRNELKYQNFCTFKDLTRIGREIEDDLRGTSKKPQRSTPRVFTDIGCTYTYALERLKAQGKLNPIGPTPEPTLEQRPKWYRPEAYCAYHQGKGHDTEKCFRLKHEIQDMIEDGTIPIPTVKPNNVTNPFGDHSNAVSANEINGIWDDDEDDVYLEKGAAIPYTRDEVQKLRKEALEFNQLTRAGRSFRVEKATNAPTAQAKEPTVVEALSERITQEVPLIKQLQKTKVDVSIWELILSSFEHRQALLQALMSMNVSPDIAPNDVVVHVVQNPPRHVNAVTFSDEDLPSIRPKHGLAMYIVVTCLQKHVLMTLVDDGSILNVLPLRTAHVLGLDKKDLTPTTQTVRAFDGTIRRVAGIVDLVVQIGFIERKVSCQVIDVASSFNLLLGRPWIHGVKVVSSTLHRKIKVPLKGETVTIDATPIVVTEGDLASEVTLDTSNDACRFEVINVIDSCPELENTDLYIGSHVCETILKTGKYFRSSLYPRKEDTLVLKGVVLKGTTFGLGYEPTEQDLEKKRRTVIDRKPYPLTLNGYFVKAAEAERCLDFPEPLFDEKSKKLVPVIEIFQVCHYIPEDVLSVTPRKAEPTPVEDRNALGLVFGEEREMKKPNEELVSMILRNDRFDPSTLITDVAPKGTISRWRKTIKWTDNRGLLFKLTTEEGEMVNPDDDSESESEFESDKSLRVESKESSVENTSSSVFPFDVPPPSSGIPTPIPNTTPIPPLTSDQLAQIDMPGIDREIAEHKIPIKSGFKPIKQKLHRIRTEWSLKVKEEIDKQFKAGFIKVSKYSDWVANVVPVPKKDGKVRVCGLPGFEQSQSER